MTVDAKSGRAWFNGMSWTELHPCSEPEGWPEFEVTLSFYVSDEDSDVQARERWRIVDLLPDAIWEATDGRQWAPEDFYPPVSLGDGSVERPWKTDGLIEWAKRVRWMLDGSVQ